MRGLVAALRLAEVPLFAVVREPEVADLARVAGVFAAEAFEAEAVRRAVGLPAPEAVESLSVGAAGPDSAVLAEADAERPEAARDVRDEDEERPVEDDVAAEREVGRRFGAGAPSASGAGSFVVT
ncbi:hypothetical protein [Schumannella soli]|uniref:Uncharacterized protein n=1 Tax=Schumannella soli TaxID=2590779 RepID=A0A506Y369_9MICO|nr:hypothetical protein [Schumannella soli]TPW75877.1 hypothetical protein FJ657_08470 [Schumannella soli]